MEPSRYYRQNIDDLQETHNRLRLKKSGLGWLRLGTVGLVIAAFYFLWNIGLLYLFTAIIALVIIFVRVLLADLQNREALEYTNRLLSINKDELRFLEGDHHIFPDGSEHIPSEHYYANDLDITGKDSLFQYLNRTTSEMGSRQLADYLQFPASIEGIAQRQVAVRELARKNSWVQELQAKGKEKKVTFSTQQRLQMWMEEPPVFLHFKPWQWLRYLLPLIILSVLALYIDNAVPSSVFYGTLLIFAAITYQINKYVAPIHEKLSKMAPETDILSGSLKFIEDTSFESPLLEELKKKIFSHDQGASREIRRLHQLLDRLDLRYNMVLSLPLNLLLLWNLQQVLNLEKWKTGQQKNVHPWFEILGHLEALSSLSVLHFNRPEWAFPEITAEYFMIEGNQIGHPLIPDSKRITNDISIPQKGAIMLVTGSNMAGKSTYLRSIGINVVLAMAGGPVCAGNFKVSHVQLISSMRVSDNLAESTSTFYAELKKLKKIIEKVNEGERVFILLDEILRGTNSLDRHTGSVALTRQLIRHQSAAIIATHDLELASLKSEFPDNLLNYHFDVQVSGDELFFDYRLKSGVCNSLNASLLMKKIGIEL